MSQLALPPAVLLNDIRLLLPSGDHRQGADVYRFVMRRIWWSYPLFLLSITPGLAALFDGAYRRFAAGRHRFSRACRLQTEVTT